MQELDLGMNKIGDDGALPLLRCINKIRGNLSLHGCNIGLKSVGCLAEELTKRDNTVNIL